MKFFGRIGATALAASLYLQQCAADMTEGTYSHVLTGIRLKTWSSQDGGFTFGMTLPDTALEKDANEYIGLIRCKITPSTNGPGYCGISHGNSGQMSHSLLLVAWPYNGTVYTSFRYATGYTLPNLYTGDAKLTQIASRITADSFEVLYRCQNCFFWDYEGDKGNSTTSQGFLTLGWAGSKGGVRGPTCPDTATFGFHDNGFDIWGFGLQDVVVPSRTYSQWTAWAFQNPKTTCEGTGPVGPKCVPAPDETFDYIVVGAGAGGIPVADKLSEAGYKVLLIEKGPPSTGRWNGTMKPTWLQGTNLTRFDVPGLCNQIWVDSAGIACTDTDQMAGCVLGGGVAVNAGLWWKPPKKDWDENFPEGWKSSDVEAATKRVFERIPGSWHPSSDGKLYYQEGYDVLASGLRASGWTEVIANEEADQKNRTFAHTHFMFHNGERDGPLATYLVSAYERENFRLWTNTAVRRALRTGGTVTGVELECLTTGGFNGTVKLNPGGGVIFSAGAFGSAKLLLRSGIGPQDQLEIVASSKDGATFIDRSEWINLPVGYNLIDHLNTDIIVDHPDVVYYNFFQAWWDPPEEDKKAYLERRSGILTQSAPNIGPAIWEEVTPSDGIVRQLQWTARIEADMRYTRSPTAVVLSLYLGRGVVSRGRMTITPALVTTVSEHPYLHDAGDREAVITGIKNLVDSLSVIPNITFVLPPKGRTIESWFDSLFVSPATRRANHWMGTAKLGPDDGRQPNGTSVVDLDTKVYGTENLFVVDASIFPGMSTGNPSAMIVIASERAAERILALRK